MSIKSTVVMTKHPRETKDSIKVIGIQTRTTNENNQHAEDIPKLWAKFQEEKVFDKIPNKKSNELIGLYSDYESDFTKPYNYMICCEVTSLEDVPEGFVSKIVPTADYIIFKAQGKFPECLIKTWEKIWNSDLKRAYHHDFEIYKKMDSNQSEIDVYIGVKSQETPKKENF